MTFGISIATEISAVADEHLRRILFQDVVNLESLSDDGAVRAGRAEVVRKLLWFHSDSFKRAYADAQDVLSALRAAERVGFNRELFLSGHIEGLDGVALWIHGRESIYGDEADLVLGDTPKLEADILAFFHDYAGSDDQSDKIQDLVGDYIRMYGDRRLDDARINQHNDQQR